MTNRMNRQLLSGKSRNNRKNTRNEKILSACLILVILFLSLGTIQSTLGRFLRSNILTDSAKAVKFDVDIVTTEAFLAENGDTIFEYRFLSETDIQGVAFGVTNNGETDVVCEPYISGNITHRIYVEEGICSEFIVSPGETIDFWLIFTPDGLDTNTVDTAITIDIQQVEGR